MKKTYKGFAISIVGSSATISRMSDGWELGDEVLEGDSDEEADYWLGEAYGVIDEYLEYPGRYEEDCDDDRPDEWEPYEGDYEKQEYDIRLQDNRIVKNCWPNAGKFNPLFASPPPADPVKSRHPIPGDQVRKVRASSPTSLKLMEAMLSEETI